jgi:hypothetical protein
VLKSDGRICALPAIVPERGEEFLISLGTRMLPAAERRRSLEWKVLRIVETVPSEVAGTTNSTNFTIIDMILLNLLTEVIAPSTVIRTAVTSVAALKVIYLLLTGAQLSAFCKIRLSEEIPERREHSRPAPCCSL